MEGWIAPEGVAGQGVFCLWTGLKAFDGDNITLVIGVFIPSS